MGETSGKRPSPPTAADSAESIKKQLESEWLARIYTERILTGRTRSVHLEIPNRKTHVTILHTLLGVELKVGSKRILCPDLSTARYMAVFARAGISDFALPYDITQVPGFADELETSWHRMLLFIEQACRRQTGAFSRKVERLLLEDLRKAIETVGAGTRIPEFKQSTRQRKST